MRARLVVGLLVVCLFVPFAQARTADGRTKIVLIAGTKSHGPGFHEYLKSARLLKVMLDRSASLHNVVTEVYYDGWPADQTTLETADTIVFLTDGMQWSPWTWSAERIAFMQRQMDRGCGFMTFHFATYVPYQFAKQALSWNGGSRLSANPVLSRLLPAREDLFHPCAGDKRDKWDIVYQISSPQALRFGR